MMNVAIFADLHGRIFLALKIVERYQREMGQTIDAILQCGDVGIFPDVAQLDKATRRIAEKDPTELGFFKHFTAPCPEVEAVLERLSCNMICVRGNHEDHRYLDGLEQQGGTPLYPVDCYHRIWCMRTGMPYTLKREGKTLSILGIGRVGSPDTEVEIRQDKYIQPYEKKRLDRLAANERVDLLLTHDVRRDFNRMGVGMREIDGILARHAPAYHFFGHTGQPFQQGRDVNGRTIYSKLSDFEWDEDDRGGRLKDGCLGILRWHDATHHQFHVVDAPWIKEYTPHTWEYL